MQNFVEAGLIFRRRIYRSAYWSRQVLPREIWRNYITQADSKMNVFRCRRRRRKLCHTGGAAPVGSKSLDRATPFPCISFFRLSSNSHIACGKLRKKLGSILSKIAAVSILNDLNTWPFARYAISSRVKSAIYENLMIHFDLYVKSLKLFSDKVGHVALRKRSLRRVMIR